MSPGITGPPAHCEAPPAQHVPRQRQAERQEAAVALLLAWPSNCRRLAGQHTDPWEAYCAALEPWQARAEEEGRGEKLLQVQLALQRYILLQWAWFDGHCSVKAQQVGGQAPPLRLLRLYLWGWPGACRGDSWACGGDSWACGGAHGHAKALSRGRQAGDGAPPIHGLQ